MITQNKGEWSELYVFLKLLGEGILYAADSDLNKIENLTATVNPVKSTYWGENITVAGLITSEDLINTVQNISADYIIIPSIMFKPYSKLFLDGHSIDEVIEKTKKNFFINENNYSICEVIDLINQHV